MPKDVREIGEFSEKVTRKLRILIRPNGKIHKFECPNELCNNILEIPGDQNKKNKSIICSVCGDSVQIVQNNLEILVKNPEQRRHLFNV